MEHPAEGQQPCIDTRPCSSPQSASLAASAGDVVAPRPDPRPVALVAGLEDGPLKRELAACTDDPVRRTSFSLGHRGAPLHYPEHTRESYVAAAAMGAGVIECDVTFTRDKQLVCRHAQDDLHTTTDILLTPLAARCMQAFSPGAVRCPGRAARARCRASAARATSRSPNSARCAASATGSTRVRAPSKSTCGAARRLSTRSVPAPAR